MGIKNDDAGEKKVVYKRTKIIGLAIKRGKEAKVNKVSLSYTLSIYWCHTRPLVHLICLLIHAYNLFFTFSQLFGPYTCRSSHISSFNILKASITPPIIA